MGAIARAAVLILAMAVAACASSERPLDMRTGKLERVSTSPVILSHRIMMSTVSGASAPGSFLTPPATVDDFREALRLSLQDNDLLNENGSGTHVVTAQLVEIVQPDSGFAIRVSVRVLYKLYSALENRLVFSEEITGVGEAGILEVPIWGRRLKTAVDRAMQDNLRRFISQLLRATLRQSADIEAETPGATRAQRR
jgi:hypothetical protein